MDINDLKGRISEAFVEAMLRRAGYFVSRSGREAHVPRVMKRGNDAYLPDFLAWRQEGVTGEAPEKPLYSVLAVEVKYRANPEEFLRREASQILADARQHWPDFCIVLVTDTPEDGRSCFQVLRWSALVLLEPVDLADAGLYVYPGTAAAFSALLKEVFRVLGEAAVGEDLRR